MSGRLTWLKRLIVGVTKLTLLLLLSTSSVRLKGHLAGRVIVVWLPNFYRRGVPLALHLAVAAADHDSVHASAIAQGRHLSDIDRRRLGVLVILRRGGETRATFGAYRCFLAVLLHLEQV